jgi:hypothetical protein
MNLKKEVIKLINELKEEYIKKYKKILFQLFCLVHMPIILLLLFLILI